jgi:hypothetical protein
MAAQSITTDLTLVNNAEPGTLGDWSALGGGQAGTSEETDYFIQGSTSISKQVKQETKGMHADAGSSQTFGTGDHVYVWMYSTTPGAGDTRANGGLRITLGASSNARDEFYVNGSDTYKYGGWICYPVDPTATPDNVIGAGAGTTPRYFGGIMSNSVSVKGVNFGIDVIRYGTGIDATGGGSPDPDLTFNDIATEDALNANAYGILQPTAAGTSLQGRVRIGADDTTTTTVFNDVDAVLTKANNNPTGVNQKTASNFSGIILAGSQTTATFDGCLFIGLDTTDLGFFDSGSATNLATVTLTNTTFLDWGTTTLSSSTTTTNSTWKNCGAVTLNSGSISSCTFQNSDPVVAGNDLANISNCSFTRGSNTHAITTSISTGTISFVGNSFSGYNAADGQVDSAIEFTASTGSVTINVSGGATPSILKQAGLTVTFQTSSTLTLTGLQLNTEVRIYNAGTTTEVAGVENSGTSESFSISVSSVDIVIHALGYIYQKLSNVDTSTSRSLPIQQQEDRQYENP